LLAAPVVLQAPQAPLFLATELAWSVFALAAVFVEEVPAAHIVRERQVKRIAPQWRDERVS